MLSAVLVLAIPKITTAAAGENAIKIAVNRHFAAQVDHQPGDLIRRSDLLAVLKLLDGTRVPVGRFAELQQYIPADSSEIQRLNSNPKGRRFLRNVANVPGGYAGIEDLASRPRGAHDLRQLVKTPGGETMIEYMTTTPGGAKMMAMTPKGKETRKLKDEPRIYTAVQLLDAMVRMERAAAAADK